ncbi:putative ATPase (AAA+ superfamily) [Salinivirga cyanobacteriivorans]|uniref:Putative ATPase (AAA+ superfamily) n=1 Tax=Salinivirga cyanobacteriivorans TaxID=1307839 RepID=A0A0S2HYZ7_9BACT|nr:ATP-binding protein [Salinivirga cyanobacteriivorans]ALO15236.1 putative ATPase (AAA+ superfamily) [Salinivirga cyanobacteriivorans]
MSATNRNPFPISAYQGAAYFCDRKEELQFMENALTNGESITLMAIRRIGKTGLIHHFKANKPDDMEMIYVDILDTENMSDFLNKLSSAILTQFKEKSGIGKKMWEFVKSLRPTISFDPLTGAPQASFTKDSTTTASSIESVFQFLEQQNTTFVIAIDEFQQIMQYPEQNVDAWLRARVQSLKNIRFIFSGSQQHLMTELFANADRPFFRSTAFLRLQKINKEAYSKFIYNQFTARGKKIKSSIINEILDWTEVHTYYVQQLCNRIYASGANNITNEVWRNQAASLIKEQEILFFSFRNMLSKNQWEILKAIAKEGVVYQPTSTKFIKKYNLNTSATIIKALSKLIETGLVFKDYNHNGVSYYSMYDVFFKRWSEQKQ